VALPSSVHLFRTVTQDNSPDSVCMFKGDGS
jgi:hypothetical protein